MYAYINLYQLRCFKFWEVFFKGPHRREIIKILSNLLLSLLSSELKKK